MEAFFEAGLCDGSIGQDYYKMGELTVNYLYDLITGKGLSKPDKTFGDNNNIPWYSSGAVEVLPETYKQVFATLTPWQ
jgi:hypothetical protein